jgi:hypothetical protein
MMTFVTIGALGIKIEYVTIGALGIINTSNDDICKYVVYISPFTLYSYHICNERNIISVALLLVTCYTLILLCKFNTLGTCFVKIIIVFDIIWKNKRHEIDNNRTIKHLTKLLLKTEPLKLNSLTVLFCVGQLLLS